MLVEEKPLEIISGQKEYLRGIAASPGRVYGKSLLLISSSRLIRKSSIQIDEVEMEIGKFRKSIGTAREELENSIEFKRSLIDRELIDILSAQVLMLEDPTLINGVERRISTNLENAPYALYKTIEEIAGRLESLNDEYLRERAEDIRDLGRKLGEYLLGEQSDYTILSDLPEDVILVTHKLTPAQILHMDKTRVRGIATDLGGRTGHMAILAKNYGIPAVVGLKDITDKIQDGEYILLDADDGSVVRFPSFQEVKNWGISEPYFRRATQFSEKNPILTLDGQRVKIFVNIEMPEDCKSAILSGAEGVGLYRSEAMILENPEELHDEEKQYQIYKKLAEKMSPFPVTIRTYDLGGDKLGFHTEEDNPFLGNRGIRYCLQNVDFFKTQLRAILRASVHGKLQIMIPMVSYVSEVIQARMILEESKLELKQSGISFEPDIKFGIMVETPSCALVSETFLPYVDFFSIGTNDLLQYVMAVDRNNEYISELYNPLNYAFLKVLKGIIDSANEKKIPISLCGELASDTNFTILLLGMGLRSFSVSLPFVSVIQKIVNMVEIKHTEKLMQTVFRLSREERYSEIESFLFNKHLIST